MLSSSLHIDICSISFLYILLYFPFPCILHLQYFSSVYFTFLSSSLLICISIISVLYIFLYFPYLCILASVVFQPCILHFAFLVSVYWHLQCFSSVYFTLLFTSLNNTICRISVLNNLLYFLRFCKFIFAIFQSA